MDPGCQRSGQFAAVLVEHTSLARDAGGAAAGVASAEFVGLRKHVFAVHGPRVLSVGRLPIPNASFQTLTPHTLRGQLPLSAPIKHAIFGSSNAKLAKARLVPFRGPGTCAAYAVDVVGAS